MAQLKIEQEYKVCNGVLATTCASFSMHDVVIYVHRPVDNKKRTMLHGWQFSVDGVPISYLGGIGVPRIDAVHSFIIRSLEITPDEWRGALTRTVAENQRRLREAEAPAT